MIGYYPELHTEYARRKDIECYDIESKGRAARAVANAERPINQNLDSVRCHANPDERPQIFPVVGPGHQRPVEEVV